MYVPPTKLVQIYYKCVMSPQEAWFNSLGIAQANSVVYTSLFFSVLMYILVNYLNYVKKVNPKVKTLASVAIETSNEEAEIKASIKQFAVLREAMLNGSLGFVYDVKAAYERGDGNKSSKNNDDDKSSENNDNDVSSENDDGDDSSENNDGDNSSAFGINPLHSV